MKINKSTDQRLDELEDAVGEVKEELTGLKIEMEDKFEEQGKKLDKILEVVLTKEAKAEQRLARLEQVNGIVGAVQ